MIIYDGGRADGPVTLNYVGTPLREKEKELGRGVEIKVSLCKNGHERE